ncbi:MAG: NapC/NirT family cytochrome c, partial [Gemmatimonadales bacterium]|nr:NapC/NirT family cytochrome c [Gemmatimonadales bacterium]
MGVALATSAFLLFVFMELLRITGILTNSYIGLISYMALPALFILGLILVPISWWQFKRATGRTTEELLSQRFPDDMTRAKRMGSSLLATIALLTVVNILFLGVGGARMLHFMDQPVFCGTACHPIMEPEWVAYQNSPHANVHCVECHVGEGATALLDAKLNGLWQVVSSTFDLYEKPIPTPVHQLRPARETCEKCHWPDKFYGDRIKAFTSFAFDEESTPSHTTLALKVGAGAGDNTGTIHWHVAAENEIRYRAADEKRQVMDWVEVRRGDYFHRYTNSKLDEKTILHPVEPKHDQVLSMDCMDCHNRATHIYLDPEDAVDIAMVDGRIPVSLPFAKRAALEALTGEYPDQEAAMRGIENSVRGFYLRDLDDSISALSPEADQMVETLQTIYNQNIFFPMNVGWNTYPTHLGHRNGSGCFRCHTPDMVDEEGVAIPYDCTLCHSILAMDSVGKFQYLQPLKEKDPDRTMHQYLRGEFLGISFDEADWVPEEEKAAEGTTEATVEVKTESEALTE